MYKFADNGTYTFVRVSKMSSQTTSTPQKAPKRRRKPKYKSGSSDFFPIGLGNLGKTSFVSVENTLYSVALVNYNERDTLVQRSIFIL